MGKYSNNCIVCDKPIEKTKGKAVIRCEVCNNTIHEKHSEICEVCDKIVCMNDIKNKDKKVICKLCEKKL